MGKTRNRNSGGSAHRSPWALADELRSNVAHNIVWGLRTFALDGQKTEPRGLVKRGSGAGDRGFANAALAKNKNVAPARDERALDLQKSIATAVQEFVIGDRVGGRKMTLYGGSEPRTAIIDEELRKLGHVRPVQQSESAASIIEQPQGVMRPAKRPISTE